jgi:hypothetical protein
MSPPTFGWKADGEIQKSCAPRGAATVSANTPALRTATRCDPMDVSFMNVLSLLN